MSEAPRCMYKAPVAKVVSPIHREVCITPRQHLRLFAGSCRAGACPPRPLGCGMWACVFPTSDRHKVVKLTRDEQDPGSIRAAGPKYAPRLYAAWKLENLPEAKQPVHGMILERLEPVERLIGGRALTRQGPDGPEYTSHGEMVNAWLDCATDTTRRRGQTWKAYRRVVNMLPEVCCVLPGRLENAPERHTWLAGCKQYVENMAEAQSGLQNRRIFWQDIHAANTGWSVKDRRWKILDLGGAGRRPRGFALLRGSRPRR